MPIVITEPIIVGGAQGPSGTATTPHWNFPVTFNTTGGVGVVEQDTLDEVFANVKMIAVCPQGACPELPAMGVPSVAFTSAPPDPAPITQAIELQEPRATQQVISQVLDQPYFGAWLLAHTTQYAGGDK